MLNPFKILSFLHEPEKIVDYENPYKEPVVEKVAHSVNKNKSDWFYRDGELLYAGERTINIFLTVLSVAIVVVMIVLAI